MNTRSQVLKPPGFFQLKLSICILISKSWVGRDEILVSSRVKQLLEFRQHRNVGGISKQGHA